MKLIKSHYFLITSSIFSCVLIPTICVCSCFYFHESIREEQYKQMWSELETFVRAHCHTDQHTRVLHCLLECRNKDDEKLKVEKVELDQALRELDQ